MYYHSAILYLYIELNYHALLHLLIPIYLLQNIVVAIKEWVFFGGIETSNS